MGVARFYICRTSTPEGTVDHVSLLPPDHGLIAEAIVGALRKPLESGEPDLSPENFARNATFVDLLQAIVRHEVPGLARYQEEARSTGDGPVYVIDQRAAGQSDPILPEDVFGAFEASGGIITPESYEANPTHRMLSERGFFQLEDDLMAILIDELQTRSRARQAGGGKDGAAFSP